MRRSDKDAAAAVNTSKQEKAMVLYTRVSNLSGIPPLEDQYWTHHIIPAILKIRWVNPQHTERGMAARRMAARSH